VAAESTAASTAEAAETAAAAAREERWAGQADAAEEAVMEEGCRPGRCNACGSRGWDCEAK